MMITEQSSSSNEAVTRQVGGFADQTAERTNPLGVAGDTVVDGDPLAGEGSLGDGNSLGDGDEMTTNRVEIEPAEELGFDQPSWGSDGSPRFPSRVSPPPLPPAVRAGSAERWQRSMPPIPAAARRDRPEQPPRHAHVATASSGGAAPAPRMQEAVNRGSMMVKQERTARTPAPGPRGPSAGSSIRGSDVVLQALKPSERPSGLTRRPVGAAGPRGAAAARPQPPAGRDGLMAETVITGGRPSPLPWLLVGFVVVIAASVAAGVFVRRAIRSPAPAAQAPAAQAPGEARRAAPAPAAAPRPSPSPQPRPAAATQEPRRTKDKAPGPAEPAPSSRRPEALAALAAQLPRAPALLRRGDYRAAHEIFAAVLAQNPDDPLALAGFARSGVELGSAEALAPLARSSVPSHRQLQRQLRVRLLVVNRRWQEAEGAWRELAPAERKRPAARLQLAQIKHGAGEIEDARQRYEALVAELGSKAAPSIRVAALVGYSEVLLVRRYRSRATRYARRAAKALKQGKLEGGPLAARVAAQLERCARR